MIEKLRELRTKALSSPVFMALLLMAFFKPEDLLKAYPTANTFTMWWKMAVMLCVAAIFILRPRLSAASVLLCLYQAVLLVSILLNDYRSGLLRWEYRTANIVALCMLVDAAASEKPRTLVKTLFWGLGLFYFINLATLFLFPGGMDYNSKGSYYFLGIDNAHGFYIIPLVTAALLYSWYKNWSFWFQLGLLAVFTASIYFVWSATSVVGVSIFIGLFLLCRVKKSHVVLNAVVYYLVIVLVFVLLVVLRVPDKLSFLIEGILHKDMTLSGRLALWELKIAAIMEKPLFGYGGKQTQAVLDAFGYAFSCHNWILQPLYDGGIVGALVYWAAVLLPIRPLMRTRDSHVGYTLAAGLFSFLLIMEAESPSWPRPIPFYTLLLLCYHAEKVVSALEPPKLPEPE